MGKVKVFVNYYRPLLEKFLNPLSVLKLMPCLNDKGKLFIVMKKAQKINEPSYELHHMMTDMWYNP